MKITAKQLSNKNQTGNEMHRLINRYSSDMRHIKVWRSGRLVPLSMLTLQDIFEMVKNIPYRRDVKPIEVVARPLAILRNKEVGMDCKKKAILLSCYLKERGLPFRLIASSRLPNKRIHHVFPQVRLFDSWENFDATYPHYKPFEVKKITKAEVL